MFSEDHETQDLGNIGTATGLGAETPLMAQIEVKLTFIDTQCPKPCTKITLSTLRHASPKHFSFPYLDLIGDKLN